MSDNLEDEPATHYFRAAIEAVHVGPDGDDNAEKQPNQKSSNNPQSPPGKLFRWHVRQAILIHTGGAGEPIFEHEFPSGSDMMGRIRRGPRAAERMEAELFGRLAVGVDLSG